ncbi:insecticidal delta-endotoxin Cry8Ea1 family protein [Bacillus thuringiensis]|uniref:insecticidal delta-endotoxin Cry8Ea1 family protein n=1 Tax=Bacillus thuringiensis TaxID=1428 RepID=UPI000CD9A3DB|nr:insecticidal delta-endotoxin Cry8Ea1 family protein [Bacillus thuringiensis]
MNPYNNESYEIIDLNTSPYPSNRNNSRYPYANACGFPENVDWTAGASAMIIVAGTLLSAIGSGGVGIVAAGIISVGTLFPFFWPQDKPTAQVWKDFIKQGDTITNKTISAAVESLVLAELNGLKSILDVYTDALELWKKDKNNIVNRDNVKSIFTNLHLQFVAAMPKFATNGYEVILLSTYTAAALLHITFLHEALQYANEWNLARSEGTFYRGQLIQAIENYINYCEKWYREGLEILKNSTWDIYAAYQNEYTLSILNVISIFPRFDIRNFPTNIATRLESTQKLYTTTPNMKALKTNNSIDYIKDKLIPPLDLFKKLKSLTFYTFLDSNNQYDHLQGIVNNSYYTNISTNKIFSSGTTEGSSYQLGLASDQVIYYTDIFHHLNQSNFKDGSLGIKIINFNIINKYNEVSQKSYDSNATSNLILEVILPFLKTTEKDYKYILSYITITPQQIVGCLSPSYIYGFIWTHSSVNLNNTIHYTNKNNFSQITQISAVKAYLKKDRVSVIEGPGHTGGDLVKFTQWDDSISTHYQFTSSGEYKIRVRYASTAQVNQTSGLSMTIYHKGNPTETWDLNINNKSDTILNLNEPKYNHFQYTEFPNKTLIINKDPNSPYLELRIDLSYKGNTATTLIDKIEFIPVS